MTSDPSGAAWRRAAKRWVVGRMAAAARRSRRAPLNAVRSEWADRRDRRAGRVPPPGPRRSQVRSVVCIPAGPGSLEALLDTIDSVLASDGDAAQVLVVDDASVDARESLIRERFPEVEVVRRRMPTGGPPNIWPLVAIGMREALARWDFEQLVKMDTDAVFCGPGFSEATLARWEAAPGAGLAGSCRVRCDGEPEDRVHHAQVLQREMRGDRMVAAAVTRARERGWPLGEIVQGGVCCITRDACAAVVDQGWIGWRRPWHSAITGDLATSLFVRAAGFELLSIGDPDGIFAVANKHLPLPVREIADGRWLAAHSVRRGLNGEHEWELRAALRARREAWRVAGVGTPSSASADGRREDAPVLLPAGAPSSALDPSSPTGPAWRRVAKRVVVGRMAAAARRLRAAPLSAVRSEWADRRDRRAGRVPPPGPRRSEVRSVVCIPAGPGSLEGLLDTIDSVLASDGDAAQVLVVDDASVDAREALVRERFPQVDVMRRRRPTGGPPNLWPMVALAIERALESYDFEQLVKMDTDAVFCGPGFSEATLARLQAAPEAGMAGSHRVRCDGQPEDRDHHAQVLQRELPRDRLLAAALARAQERDWPLGEIVQGGVFCITRDACAAIVRQGWVDWRRPWHSAISEDLATSLFVRAAGFELLSIGDPDGIFAVANKHLPLPIDEIADGPWVAGHSLRRGLHGEREWELRSYLRGRRAAWTAAPVGA